MPNDDFCAALERWSRGLPEPDAGSVGFLAGGEYSLNYLVRGEADGEPDGVPDFVTRLATGTQMGLPLGEQDPYEHHALELLAPSGVNPRPYHVHPAPAILERPRGLAEPYLS